MDGAAPWAAPFLFGSFEFFCSLKRRAFAPLTWLPGLAGPPVRLHRSAAASLSPPNVCSPAVQGAYRKHLNRVIPAHARAARWSGTIPLGGGE